MSVTDHNGAVERVATGRRGEPILLARLKDDWQWESAPVWHALFIAADATTVDDASIMRFASTAVAQRCAWVATWGPECERVHDLFDQAYLEADAAGAAPSMLMSMWDADESLASALWNCLNTWAPDEPDARSGQDFPPVVAYVQEPWLFETRRLLVDPDELNRLVLESD